jgi:hypothetical protein
MPGPGEPDSPGPSEPGTQTPGTRQHPGRPRPQEPDPDHSPPLYEPGATFKSPAQGNLERLKSLKIFLPHSQAPQVVFFKVF